MQLGHLLLADLVWISFVVLVANYLWRSETVPESGVETAR
jgi:hypothetical protein